MSGWNNEVLLLTLLSAIGVALAAICLAGWRLRQKQVKAHEEILRMKRVIEDLVSVHERNIANLRAELGVVGPSKRIVSTSRPKTMEALERKKHIWNLAEKGLSPDEITRRMNMPRGQVDLLLNMRTYANGAHA